MCSLQGKLAVILLEENERHDNTGSSSSELHRQTMHARHRENTLRAPFTSRPRLSCSVYAYRLHTRPLSDCQLQCVSLCDIYLAKSRAAVDEATQWRFVHISQVKSPGRQPTFPGVSRRQPQQGGRKRCGACDFHQYTLPAHRHCGSLG